MTITFTLEIQTSDTVSPYLLQNHPSQVRNIRGETYTLLQSTFLRTPGKQSNRKRLSVEPAPLFPLIHHTSRVSAITPDAGRAGSHSPSTVQASELFFTIVVVKKCKHVKALQDNPPPTHTAVQPASAPPTNPLLCSTLRLKIRSKQQATLENSKTFTKHVSDGN